MMKLCNIVKDLLPLYVDEDDVISADTRAFVADHLEGCLQCAAEAAELGRDKDEPIKLDKSAVMPLEAIKRGMFMQKLACVVAAVLFVAALLTSLVSYLTAPQYVSYSIDVVDISKTADGELVLAFNESITGYDITYCPGEDEEGGSYYIVEAWSSIWDTYIAERSRQAAILDAEGVNVCYNPNDGNLAVPIYTDEEDVPTPTLLPRLNLMYYLLLMAAVFVIIAVLWVIFRKRETVRIWLERLALGPVAYCAGHMLVKGLLTTSYALMRDLALICLAAVLIYGALLLVHGVITARRKRRVTA